MRWLVGDACDSVYQLMLEAVTRARVNQHPTFAISLALVAASIVSWFTLIASIADNPAQALSPTVTISVNQALVKNYQLKSYIALYSFTATVQFGEYFTPQAVV